MISKLFKKNLVIELSKIEYEKDHWCHACKLEKQTSASIETKDMFSTTRILSHTDLFSSTMTFSLGRKIICSYYD